MTHPSKSEDITPKAALEADEEYCKCGNLLVAVGRNNTQMCWVCDRLYNLTLKAPSPDTKAILEGVSEEVKEIVSMRANVISSPATSTQIAWLNGLRDMEKHLKQIINQRLSKIGG